jgi:PKD repeat protein
VEFAIVLPILLLLTLTALDFGRVYLGWINLQSMSRIAANLAANNPTAWQGGGDANVKAKYQNQIRSDAAATNCQLPLVAGVRTAPAPVFIDTNGNGATDDIGDSASVSLSCTFSLITPGIKNIVGNNITVSASTVFPVSTGMTSTMGGGPVGTAPNAAFTGNGTLAPSPLSGTAPFTVQFRDTSGGNPNSWLWTFPDTTPATTSTLQDPAAYTFTSPGTFIVTMQATNSLGSSTESMAITVTNPTTVDFTYSLSAPNAPSIATFADNSSPGGTTYAWTFGSGQGSGTGKNTTHTYSSAGTYDVTLTVTYPTGPVSVTKQVTLGSSLCTVPSFNGIKRNNAQALYTSSGFTGTVSNGPGAPNGNFTILSQSVTANSQYPCNGNITVNNP